MDYGEILEPALEIISSVNLYGAAGLFLLLITVVESVLVSVGFLRSQSEDLVLKPLDLLII